MPTSHDSRSFVVNRGPVILSVESVFWHWQRYPRRRSSPHRPPLTEPARPREIEDPFRVGRGRAFRVPMTRRGLVVGFWLPAGASVPVTEQQIRHDQALAEAYGPTLATTPTLVGVTADQIRDWGRPKRPWTVELRDLLHRLQQALPGRASRFTVKKWDDNLPILDLEDARTGQQYGTA